MSRDSYSSCVPASCTPSKHEPSLLGEGQYMRQVVAGEELRPTIYECRHLNDQAIEPTRMCYRPVRSVTTNTTQDQASVFRTALLKRHSTCIIQPRQSNLPKLQRFHPSWFLAKLPSPTEPPFPSLHCVLPLTNTSVSLINVRFSVATCLWNAILPILQRNPEFPSFQFLGSFPSAGSDSVSDEDTLPGDTNPKNRAQGRGKGRKRK